MINETLLENYVNTPAPRYVVQYSNLMGIYYVIDR